MTGKRFAVIREVYQVYKDLTLYEVSDGIHTFLIYENAQELTDLLNNFAEENEELKKENKELKAENEQLKQNCKNYNWYKQYKELLNEYMQLKRILHELSDMFQFDVENGIRSYPAKLSEYLSNALKEYKE